MSDSIFGVLILISFFTLGLSFWALGQWLRKKGHGGKLDHIDKQITDKKNIVRRYLVNPVRHTVASALSKAPVFGKHYKDIPKKVEKPNQK
ncbi:hypothetical protein [Acinetobacter sp. DSM 11652]|uniref:hypothetical protein n=1 Tax=Acinetobacter sp. DSM 11652 TaxID=346222 RepID=UPI0008BA9DA3|nr:hypothetical protein [Acinetobacter sp. DSM 11652]SEM30483.1 hypothetical protein SAMN05216500_11913 [Acinetobacter sp. DSM 11652]